MSSARAALDVLPVRDERVRRIALAAAKGGGGLLGVGTAIAGAAIGVGLLQAGAARRAIGPRRAVPPYIDGRYYPGAPSVHRTSLRFVVIGDSAAAGLGVDRADQTPGVLLAKGVAEAAARPVLLSCVAVVGARSRDLDDQVTRALQIRPHLALIIIGANDITHATRPHVAVRLLHDAVARLHAQGCAVVVGTCPDLGSIQPVAQPLRAYARRASRELAQAQAGAARSAGGVPVPLGAILGPAFQASPEEYFSADRFHPSATGYAACVRELLPAALEALEQRGEVPTPVA